jgi:hypothetical protein
MVLIHSQVVSTEGRSTAAPQNPPKLTAQMPVPVPRSSTHCGFEPIGAQCSRPSRSTILHHKMVMKQLSRNATLRMNGFPVGGWHDLVDPGRSRIEIEEAFQASISDNAMQQRRGRENPEKSKRRKRLKV